MQTKSKHKGAKNELIACTWLLNQGYEVFRNVSPFGEIDIIAVKDGKTLYLDVKSGIYNSKKRSISTVRMKSKQLSLGVKFLYVMPDGGCFLELNPKPEIHTNTFICKVCSLPFHPRRESQIYCSYDCYTAYLSSQYRNINPKQLYGEAK